MDSQFPPASLKYAWFGHLLYTRFITTCQVQWTVSDCVVVKCYIDWQLQAGHRICWQRMAPSVNKQYAMRGVSLKKWSNRTLLFPFESWGVICGNMKAGYMDCDCKSWKSAAQSERGDFFSYVSLFVAWLHYYMGESNTPIIRFSLYTLQDLYA